jgi:hypothetical protein
VAFDKGSQGTEWRAPNAEGCAGKGIFCGRQLLRRDTINEDIGLEREVRSLIVFQCNFA